MNSDPLVKYRPQHVPSHPRPAALVKSNYDIVHRVELPSRMLGYASREGYELKEAGLVMLGGAGGAMARYMLQLLALRIGLSSQIGILVVNVSGSFALGLLLSLWLAKTSYPPGLQLLLVVGFLSSFTTFSTLMWDSYWLAQNDSVLMAFLNISASVAAGLAAVVLGFLAGRLIGQVA